MVAFGDTLRQARAQKGVSLKEAEQVTRINRHHLQALEDENFAALPPLIYQRGIVRNYATYLDLDANKLLAMFEEAHGLAGNTDVIPAVKPLDMPSHWAPNFAIIAFMVVMSAVVFAWVYSAYFAPAEAVPTATEPIVTVTPVPPSALILPPSPVPPTPTPSPTLAPKPTNTPRARATATATPDQGQAVAPPDNQTSQATSAAGQASTSSESSQTAAAGQSGAVQLQIEAKGSDITVTVIADGQTVMDNETIADGGASQVFHADQFDVTTSNAATTWYVTKNGPFQMDGPSNTFP